MILGSWKEDWASAAVLLVGVAVLAAGCPAGRGEGWVTGSVWIESCRDGEALHRDGDFDLDADFYAGDPLFDITDAQGQARSKLMVRMQSTSNPIGESDSVAIQFLDMADLARSYVRGEGLSFSDDGLLPAATDIGTSARMQLQLFNTCPGNRSSISALPWPLQSAGRKGNGAGEQCLMPGDISSAPPGCPQFSPADQQALDRICGEQDFNTRTSRSEIERILGAGSSTAACLYVCELGKLTRQTPEADLLGYELPFNQQLAVLFHANLADPRAFRLNRCAGATARLTGRFRFALVRSRAAQPFP